MERFNPPGLSDGFTRRPGQSEAFARGWDAIVESWMQENEGPRGRGFYDPRSDETPGEPATQSVPWDAFPRFLEKWYEEDAQPDLMRWRTAETLRPRLFGGQPLRRMRDGTSPSPWRAFIVSRTSTASGSPHRDGEGHIVRLTFTCEGPGYWQFLAGGTAAFFDADIPERGSSPETSVSWRSSTRAPSRAASRVLRAPAALWDRDGRGPDRRLCQLPLGVPRAVRRAGGTRAQPGQLVAESEDVEVDVAPDRPIRGSRQHAERAVADLRTDSDVVTGPVVPGAPVEPLLAVDEIQGNVLPGFNTLNQMLLGLKLPPDDVESARPWLRDLVPLVSTLAQVSDFRNVRRRALRRGEPRPPSPIWMNLALDVNGLQRLGLAIDPIRDRSFKLGMARRSGRLDDPRLAGDEGHPDRWVVGGSFLVFRRLRQDVAAFRLFLAAEVERMRGSPAWT